MTSVTRILQVNTTMQESDMFIVSFTSTLMSCLDAFDQCGIDGKDFFSFQTG